MAKYTEFIMRNNSDAPIPTNFLTAVKTANDDEAIIKILDINQHPIADITISISFLIRGLIELLDSEMD